MFGDYFKNLTTNQKIMFGVAVFLVVCVIVYLIYKYMFKAAKNFISYYIVHREPFEDIKITVQTKCAFNQYTTQVGCSNFPANVVRAPPATPNQSFDNLRFVRSYSGKYIHYEDAASGSGRTQIYEERIPPANSVVAPEARNDMGSVQGQRTIDLQPAQPVVSTTSGSKKIFYIPSTYNGVASSNFTLLRPLTNPPGAATTVFSPLAISVPSSSSVERIELNSAGDPSGNVITSQKIYYGTINNIPNASEPTRTGNFTYLIPLEIVNFMLPGNNAIASAENTMNSAGTPTAQSGSFLSAVTNSFLAEYATASTNSNLYIINFSEQNKFYLSSLAVNALRDSAVGLLNTNYNEAVSQLFTNCSYGCVQYGSNFFLRVSNVAYRCGNQRVTELTCISGNESERITNYFYDQNSSSGNITLNGTFVPVCRPGTVETINYNRPCGSTGCALAAPVEVYNSLRGDALRLQYSSPDLFTSQFVRGQSVILPPTLTEIGIAANIPEWYSVSAQWTSNVSTFPSALGQQCFSNSVINNSFSSISGFNNYDATTDDVSYTVGSSTLRLTRKINKAFKTRDPNSWALIAVDVSNNTISTIDPDSTLPTQASLSNTIVMIAAPAYTQNTSPKWVPIFAINFSTRDTSTTYNANQQTRDTSWTVMRNIWTGVNFDRLFPTDGSALTNLAKVVRAFAALLGQVTNPVDAFFNTIEQTGQPSRKTSILYWGINSASPLDKATNPFSQNVYTFSNLVSPSTNSGNLKCGSIDVEGTTSPSVAYRYLFWINAQTNNLVVSNSSVEADKVTLVTGASLVQWSPGSTETIRSFKASGLTAGNNFKIVVTTTPQNALTSRVYILTVSVNAQSVPSNITSSSITSAAQIPDSATIRSVDMSVDGTRFLAVGDDTAIFYGTIAASVSVSRITISNSASFVNESLARLNCVRFANRNNSANTNIVLSTSLSTTPRSGFCYYGNISSNSISLTRVDALNFDIRSFAVANSDANSSTSPTIIAVAAYNGSVIVYSTPAPTAQVPTPVLYSTRNVSEINGRWTSVSAIFSNSRFLLAACSDFPNSTNGSNDGRVIFSRNAGVDWFTLPNPTKYTDARLSDIDANRLNPIGTDGTQNPSYNKLFNAYNFNAVDLTVVGQDISVFATYDPASNDPSGTTSSGLLRTKFVL